MQALETTPSGCLPSPGGNKTDALLQDKHSVAVDIPRSAGDSPRGSNRASDRLSMPLLAFMVLMTCFGITGVVLGAYATHKANALDKTAAAILVTSPSKLPYGYSLVMNLFRGSGYWSPRFPMLFPRSDFDAVSYNGKAYLIAGLSNNDAGQPTLLNSFARYDAVSNSTDLLAPLPGVWHRYAASVVGSKLYVFAGVGAIGGFTADAGTVIYDFNANTWVNKTTESLNVPRTDMCAVTINGKIYATGGYGAGLTDGTVIEMYDPNVGTWTVMNGKLAISRGDCEAVASGNKMYVLGGTEPIQPPGVDCSVTWWLCYQFSKMVEVYDPVTDTVTRLSDMPHGRGDFGAVESAPGRILVAGGEYNDLTQNVTRLLSQPWVEEYNVADDYWTPKAPLPEPRFRFAMVAAGDQILAFGGHPTCANDQDPTNETLCDRSGLDTVFAYDDVAYPPAYLAVRLDPNQKPVQEGS